MSISEIEKRINEDANIEIARINALAERKIKELNDTIEKTANDRANKILSKGKDEISLMKKQIIADAKIKAKDEIEKEKNFWIENAFEMAKTKIINLSDNEKAEILKSLSKGSENFTVYVDKKYSHLMKGIPHKTTEMEFGVVMESKDGTMRIDNTLTNRMKILKRQILPEIAKILFG